MRCAWPLPAKSAAQKANSPGGSRLDISQELRQNRGLAAAISLLSILIISFELLAHASSLVAPGHLAGGLEGQPTTQQQQKAHNLTRNHYGSSPAEARSLGCVFDELSFAWQVPECFDEGTVGEFLAASKWEYFADEAGTTKVSHSELADGRESAVHVIWAFHITHCLFLRQQMLRILERRTAMDTHLGAYKHTVHCGKMMLNSAGMAGNLHTQAPVIYPVCKTLEDWRA